MVCHLHRGIGGGRVGNEVKEIFGGSRLLVREGLAREEYWVILLALLVLRRATETQQ